MARSGGDAGRGESLRGADSSLASGPLTLPEGEFLDLAGRGFRQRSELDCIRALVASEPLAAERNELVGACDGLFVECDERLRSLSPAFVRNPDHRALEDRGVSAYGLLDLDARDVL